MTLEIMLKIIHFVSKCISLVSDMLTELRDAVQKPRITHLLVYQPDKPIAVSEYLNGRVLMKKCNLKRARKLYPIGDSFGDRFGVFCWYTTVSLSTSTSTAPDSPAWFDWWTMLSSFRFADKQGPCDAFLRLEQRAPVVAKIYPHIYPLWGIAFSLVFDYTDSLEAMLVGVTSDH